MTFYVFYGFLHSLVCVEFGVDGSWKLEAGRWEMGAGLLEVTGA
jgi:hypothetical protein